MSARMSQNKFKLKSTLGNTFQMGGGKGGHYRNMFFCYIFQTIHGIHKKYTVHTNSLMVTGHDGYLNHLKLMGYCSIPPQVSGMNTDRHFKWWNTPNRQTDKQTDRHTIIELDQLKSVWNLLYFSAPPQVSGMGIDRHFKWWNTPDRQSGGVTPTDTPKRSPQKLSQISWNPIHKKQSGL